MHHGLRREQHHAERHEREITQGERRAEHHGDEHDRRHDEGALRRDLGAGQQQIEERRNQRGERRPFLELGKRRTIQDRALQISHTAPVNTTGSYPG